MKTSHIMAAGTLALAGLATATGLAIGGVDFHFGRQAADMLAGKKAPEPVRLPSTGCKDPNCGLQTYQPK